jgi:hypothetical protein
VTESKCHDCGESFDTLERLIEHVHEAHPDRSTLALELALNRLTCSYCGERFDNVVKEMLHEKFQHPQEYAAEHTQRHIDEDLGDLPWELDPEFLGRPPGFYEDLFRHLRKTDEYSRRKIPTRPVAMMQLHEANHPDDPEGDHVMRGIGL